MSQLFTSRILLAIFISASLIACNGKGDSEEKATTDTANNQQSATPAADPDAVAAAPGLYKVLADTLGVRILEVNYKPGDSSALHRHPDYALYAVSGGKGTFFLKDGTKMDNELQAGMTMISAADAHSVKNTGTTDIKVILFEVSRSGQPTTPDAATDAVKVSPDIYKVKNDSLGIRVIEVTAKPGQKTGQHAHPVAGLYVIEPGTAEFTASDGTKTTVDLAKGMGIVTPAETHTVVNSGKTTLKAILVEVYKQ